MKEQAELIGAKLNLESKLGSGTRLVIEFSCSEG